MFCMVTPHSEVMVLLLLLLCCDAHSFRAVFHDFHVSTVSPRAYRFTALLGAGARRSVSCVYTHATLLAHGRSRRQNFGALNLAA